jgi:hypothetical protein
MDVHRKKSRTLQLSKKETKVKIQAKKTMQNVFSTKKFNLILLVVRDGFIVMLCSEVAHEVCAEDDLLINGDFICTFFLPQFTSMNNTEDQCGFYGNFIIKNFKCKTNFKMSVRMHNVVKLFACIYSSYSFTYVTFP